MRRALKLAAKGVGRTYPNPAVGCVITQSGEVRPAVAIIPKLANLMPKSTLYAPPVAPALHSIRHGSPLGQQAKGATAYVTLEPCNHYGQTPPCSQALIEAHISKVSESWRHPISANPSLHQVVVGVVDPNPLVGGQGIRTLEQAGIEVLTGCLEEQCYEINKEFMERMSSS